jgi:hypothetical protein
MRGVGAQAGRGQNAQAAAPARSWYSVSIFTVKPDRARDFVDLMKTQTIPMQQKGGIKFRDTWQGGAPFGDAATYGVVTLMNNFAEYDMPNLQTRILGAPGAQAYGDKLNAMIVGRRTFAMQDRAELSIAPAANAKIVGAILQDITVVSGHAELYEAYIKNDVLPVLKKAPHMVGTAVSRTVFGGNGNEYHVVTYLDSFAEIDKGPAQVQVLGQAAATALALKGSAHIANIERTILRYVPDLSFRAKPMS